MLVISSLMLFLHPIFSILNYNALNSTLSQHKTIESVLERGEKLDSLVEKSSDLSAASQVCIPLLNLIWSMVYKSYVEFVAFLSLRFLKVTRKKNTCMQFMFDLLYSTLLGSLIPEP